jgi:zinc transport system substrate-binding protein
VLVAAVLAACGGGGDGAAATGGRATVIAGFHPLAEAAARVGGDRVVVADLTPPGAEPHDLELDPSQVDALEDAALVLVLGRGFQPGVEEVAGRRDGPTVEVLDALGVGEGGTHDAPHDDDGHVDDGYDDDGHGHDEGAVDPHVWLDPTRMADLADEVAGALIALDPDGAPGYEERAGAFRAELAALDADFAATLGPCEGEVIVVAHEAFGWLTDRYGLVQEGIAGLAPEAEPNPQRLSELVSLVEREGVTTVFTETLVSPRVAETLAREAGVETAVLNPLEGLTDEQREAGATYEDVMRENLAALAGALPCAAPQ